MATNISTIQVTGGDYSTVSAWEAATDNDLVTAGDIEVGEGEGGVFNTAGVVIAGATVDSANYRILRAQTAAFAVMPYDGTNAFVITSTSATKPLEVQEDFFRLTNLTLFHNYTGGSTSQGVRLTNTATDFLMNRCLFRGNTSATKLTGFSANTGDYNSGIIKNCVFYDWTGEGVRSFDNTGVTIKWYNVTVRDSGLQGFREAASSNPRLIKNCLSDNNTGDDFFANTGFNASNEYNASSDATADGSNNRINQTFTYVDSANDDFHLASGDAGAKDFGVDLSGEATYGFSDDFDGDTRPATWDIGADEIVSTSTTGSGDVAVSMSLTGTATQVNSGSGDTAVAMALAGTGLVTVPVTGSGDVAVSVSLAGTGTQVYTGSGDAAVSVTLAGSGLTGATTGSGDAAVAMSLSGTGLVGSIGSGDVAVAVTLAGTGTQVYTGTGDASVTVTLAGTGTVGAIGSGDVAVAMTLSGTGTSAIPGTGDAAVAITLAGTGLVGYIGSGDVALAMTLAGSGTGLVAIAGTGDVTLALTVAGTGIGGYVGSGDAAVAMTLSATGTRTAVAAVTGKYAPEHASALADLADSTGFAAEHAAALKDLADAGI